MLLLGLRVFWLCAIAGACLTPVHVNVMYMVFGFETVPACRSLSVRCSSLRHTANCYSTVMPAPKSRRPQNWRFAVRALTLIALDSGGVAPGAEALVSALLPHGMCINDNSPAAGTTGAQNWLTCLTPSTRRCRGAFGLLHRARSSCEPLS